jgi:hypothetical protein
MCSPKKALVYHFIDFKQSKSGGRQRPWESLLLIAFCFLYLKAKENPTQTV